MDTTHKHNREQTKLWNGPAGRGWVEAQAVLDQMFRPFEDLLIETVVAGSGNRVLDVGCGTGSTTLGIARQLGAKGKCIGIDLSEQMLAVARARAEREGTPAKFIRADAQVYAFEPASFDMIVSRFGLVFFDNPVEAFANLRRAAKDRAALQFVAWRSSAENSFMTAAQEVAERFLPNIAIPQPDAPGPLAFANPDRIRRILDESGWVDINIESMDVVCTFAEKELVRYLTFVGPVGRILQEADGHLRRQVIEAVRPAFEPYIHGDEVRFTAACWMAGARATGDLQRATVVGKHRSLLTGAFMARPKRRP